MKTYKELFIRNLNSLKDEINQYTNDSDIWRLEGEIKNTPGNLCLHLCGNIKHNIGAVIGRSGYVRDRDAEFSRKDLSRDELLKEINSTLEMVNPVLDGLTLDDLNREVPEDSYSKGGKVFDVMLRVAMHFGYHLGQINYHRRIVTLKKHN